MPRLAGAGSRCHQKKGNTLRQQQQQVADILVQVPPNNYVAVVWVVVVVVVGGGCVPLVYVVLLYFLASAALSSTAVICVCLRFRGRPVGLDIELSVSARYQKTRVLLRARRILLLLVAPTSAAVCGIIFKSTCNESQAKRCSSCRYNERQLIDVTVVRRVRPRAERSCDTTTH